MKFSLLYFILLGMNRVLSNHANAEVRESQCGVRHEDNYNRRKRWTRLNGHIWGDFNHKMPVTIAFDNYWKDGDGEITRSQQEDLAKDCARMWSEVSGLEFKMVGRGQRGDINIRFKKIDGPSHLLGISLGPTPRHRSGSYIDLDSEEHWITKKSTGKIGFEMLWAMCHEMGHSLGLSHSKVRLAMMYPKEGKQPGDAKLDKDDIKGIQSLYGKSNGRTFVGGRSSFKRTRVQKRRKAPRKTRSRKTTTTRPHITTESSSERHSREEKKERKRAKDREKKTRREQESREKQENRDREIEKERERRRKQQEKDDRARSESSGSSEETTMTRSQRNRLEQLARDHEINSLISAVLPAAVLQQIQSQVKSQKKTYGRVIYRVNSL